MALNKEDHCERISSCEKLYSMQCRTAWLSHKTPEKCDQNLSSINTVLNPFKMEISSLSLPSFSPSVFSCSVDAQAKQEDGNLFQWSIDQLSTLYPAEIDHTFHQSTIEEFGEDEEQLAQKAIQSYFLENRIAPSPWSNDSKKTSSLIKPKINIQDFDKSPNSFGVPEEGLKKEVGTQTALTLPIDFDLKKLLEKYYNEENNIVSLNISNMDVSNSNNTSLRRKLFSPNRSQMESDVTQCSPLNLNGQLNVHFQTPEKDNNSFEPYLGQFSSSPISRKSVFGSSMSTSPISPICLQQRESRRVKFMQLDISPCRKCPDNKMKDIPEYITGNVGEGGCGSTMLSLSISSDVSFKESTQVEEVFDNPLTSKQQEWDDSKQDTGYQTGNGLFNSDCSGRNKTEYSLLTNGNLEESKILYKQEANLVLPLS